MCAFLAGVTLAGFSVPLFTALLASAFIIVIVMVIVKKSLFIAVFLTFALFAGFFYYFLFLNIRESNRSIVYDTAQEWSGVVLAGPSVTDRYRFFEVELDAPARGAVRLGLSRDIELHYGDRIMFKGSVLARNTKRDMPTIFPPTVKRIGVGSGSPILEGLYGFRDQVFELFRRNLSYESSALLSGLTLGSRLDFSLEFREAMKRSGTIHIVALSGYNILVIMTALQLFLHGRVRRQISFYILVIAIIFFVLMVGSDASVVRAAVMASLVLLARELGRLSHMRNAITFTAVIMILWDPGVLFTLGFLLSFLSLIGIVYLSPRLKTFISKNKDHTELGWFKETLIMTASAQIMVIPLLLATVGNVSFLGIFANLLITPLVPIAMFFGFLMIPGLVVPGFAWILAKPAALILSAMTGIIKFFGAISVPIPFTIHSTIIVALMYLLLLGFMVYSGSNSSHANRRS